MAGEPKHKHSKARKRTRRAAIILKSKSTYNCSNCGNLMLPHQVCKSCGYYNGKPVKVKSIVEVVKS